MNVQAARTRRVIVVDNSHVARRVGERIRQARTRIGLTQAQLAKGRYTAAYISALERGLAKPSMAALTFLSERLGVSVPDLVAEMGRRLDVPVSIQPLENAAAVITKKRSAIFWRSERSRLMSP